MKRFILFSCLQLHLLTFSFFNFMTHPAICMEKDPPIFEQSPPKIGVRLYDKGLDQAHQWIQFYELEKNPTPENQQKMDVIKGYLAKTLKQMFKDFDKIHSGKDIPSDLKVHLDNCKEEFQKLQDDHSLAPYHIELIGMKLECISDILDDRSVTCASVKKIIFTIASLTDSTYIQHFLKTIGHRSNLSLIQSGQVIPIYSKNGALGFHTIVYCLARGYFPLGLSTTPFLVHNGGFGGSRVAITFHDYQHALNRSLVLMKDSPISFQIYQDVYLKIISRLNQTTSIFTERTDKNNIQKETLRDIFTLFYLLHEIALIIDDPKCTFETLTRARMANDYDEARKECNEEDFDLIVSESIDLVYPLRKLGFEIRYDKQAPRTLTNAVKMNQDVVAALITLWKEFQERYPEVKRENFPSK